MKVRIIAPWYDARNDVKHPAGDIIDMSDERAAKFIGRRMAVAVAEPPVIETAEIAPPQNAAKRTTKATPRKAK